MAEESTSPTTETQEQQKGPSGLSLLASDMFGSDFHGEVKEPPKEEEAEKPEVPEPEATEEAEVETPESTEVESEEVPISSVSELITHYELDPEWFEGLKVQAKVDGEPAEFTIKELRDRAQMLQAADKRLEDAKEKAKAQTQELSQKSEALQEQFATAAKLIERAEKLIDQDTKSVDWKSLRENDPAEYSAKKAEFAERRQEIDQMKQEAATTWRESVQKQQAAIQEYREKSLPEQQGILLEKVPEWKEESKLKAEQPKVVQYLQSEGFSEDDIKSAAYNGRVLALVVKAMRYDEQATKTDVAKKKVAKVPKVMKPGTPKSQDQVSKERERKARDRLKKTGNLDDAYALLKVKRGGN